MLNEFIFVSVGWFGRLWRSCLCRVDWKVFMPYFQVSMWQGIWGSNMCKQLLLQVGVEESLCLIDSF